MKLTILGNTGPYPAPGGACSGYLLEDGGTKIVLDMGAGTLANLLTCCEIEDIDAIIISHLHWDHVSDLYVLRYALEMKGLTLKLYAPDSPADDFKRLADCSVFEVTPITADLSLQLGALTLTFCEMRHPVTDYAVKATDGKWVFMYTGDTCLCDNFKTGVQGVNTLLCDCAFLEDVTSDKHLSLRQALEVAGNAGVRHLIMTHFHPEIRPERYFQFANDRFKGRVSKAGILSKINL